MIEKIENYSDYNNSPFLLGWLSDSDIARRLEAADKQFQELEDSLFYMLDHFWIDDGAGIQLDYLGKLVGSNRNGFDDTSYKALIALQAEINIKAGSPEAIIFAVRSLIGNDNFKYEHSYPAKVIITSPEKFQIYAYYDFELMSGEIFELMDGDTLLLRDRVVNNVDIIMAILPAGVDLEIIDAPVV